MSVVKSCPNCKYIWPDDHTGQCVECGNPMSGTEANGSNDLAFRFAKQIQDGVRENEFAARAGQIRTPRQALEVYANAKVEDGLLDRARDLIVQREEVIYEEDHAA